MAFKMGTKMDIGTERVKAYCECSRETRAIHQRIPILPYSMITDNRNRNKKTRTQTRLKTFSALLVTFCENLE